MSIKILAWKAVVGFVCALSAMCSLAQSSNPQLGLSVSTPNGYANVRVDDLTLSSTAGPVRWTRQWDGREWQFNPHWESLSQSWTNLTGAQTGTPSAGAAQGATSDAAANCWVGVDDDWKAQEVKVLDPQRPAFPPMLPGRSAPFNKLMGEDDDDYAPARMVSVDYTSLCKGIPLQNSPVRDLEALRLKNELYMGENGRYAYSNRSFLEKRAVRALAPAPAATLALQLATGNMALAPIAVPKGYRWMDKAGQWIDYNTQGQVVAFGDKNDNIVWLVRDSDALLRAAVDAHGRVLFTLHYAGGLIKEVRDYPIAGMAQDLPARSVQYQYDAGARLTGVIDVRGNKTSYDYDAANHLVSITDQEQRVTRLEYAGNAVKKMVAADAGVTDFLFEYDDVNKQFISRVTGPETPAGRRVEELTHNRSGKLVRRAVNGLVEEERQYDTGARAEISTNARGFSSRTVFNEFDQVVRQEREDGSVLGFTYSALHLAKTDEVDAMGTKTHYEHDAHGNVTRMIAGYGSDQPKVVDFELDDTGRNLRQTRRGRTEPNGSVTPDAVTRWQYDARGNVSSMTDAEGAQIQILVNRAANVVRTVDARKQVTLTEVNPAGLITRVTNALNQSWTIEYDKVGNRVALTDPDLHRSSYVYDGANRRTETFDMNGRALVAYDLQGQALQVSDGDAVALRFEYDNWQRLSKQIDGAGNVIRYGYLIADGSPNGRLGSMDEPTEVVYPARVEQNRYDQMGRLTSQRVVMPGDSERATHTLYDARGALRGNTDAQGKSSAMDTDLFGRTVLVQDRLQGKTAITYDVNGKPIAITDANGRTRHMAYDRNGRLIKESLHLGQFSAMAYDANGNIEQVIDANKNKTIFKHDALNRMIEAQHFDPEAVLQRTVSMSYDGQGRLTGWVADEAGKHSASIITRDADGRKVAEALTYPGGATLKYAYTYTPGGRKSSLTLPDESVIGYGYSPHGQLATVSVPGEGMISVNAFDWLWPTTTTLPGGTVQARQYDGLGHLKSLSVTAPNQTSLLAMTNKFGLLLEKTHATRADAELGFVRSQRYDHDAELRLRKVSTEGGGLAEASETFGVDGVANRVAHSALAGNWIYDGNNRLLQRGNDPATMATYDYDNAGNVVRVTQAGKVTQFSYGSAGRLAAVSDGAGGLVARYGYDPLGRRIWKEQFRTRAGLMLTPAVRTLFLYSDEGLLAEATQDIVLGPDQSAAALSAPVLATVYGPRPDRPYTTQTLFIRTKNSNNGTTTAYYHHDDRQAPVQASDRDGRIVWAAHYDAFGRATLITPAATAQAPTIASRLRLPGQIEDEETGLHYNYHRDYDPQTGRYMQSDPIGLEGGINTYAYVGGNPLGRIDAMGLAGDDHSSGQWKDCPKGCRIRIDYTIVNGVKVRHLHWECRKGSGVGGEFGGVSHGETLDGAPDHIKECARKNKFEPDPVPAPPPEPKKSGCDQNCQKNVEASRNSILALIILIIIGCLTPTPN